MHTLTQSRAVAPRGLAWIVTRRNVPFAVIVFWWAVCFGLYAAGWPIPYTHHNILGVSALMAGTAICAAVGLQGSAEAAANVITGSAVSLVKLTV